MRAHLVLLGAALALAGPLLPATAHAERRFAVYGVVAEGAAVGDGGDSVILRRAPMLGELGLSTWSTDDDAWWIGGGVRMEFETLTSFGASLRVGLAANADALSARPFVGVTAVLAPMSLFGAEAGVDLSVTLVDPLRLLGRAFADAYFAGDDLPQGSVIVTFGGALGVEVVF